MTTIGVDPGGTGAIALLNKAGDLLWVFDIPQQGGVVSPALILDELDRWNFDPDTSKAVCWIEDVHAMPGQGVSSMFKFGRAHGTVIGVLGGLRLPIEYVTPRKWKKALGLTSDKELSRRRAIETWPRRSHLFARKKDDGRAEAALIALYGHQLRHGAAPPLPAAPTPWAPATSKEQ